MRLLEAAFDVLRRAGEPLSPTEIVRHIKSARIPIDANEPLDNESVKVELEHIVSDGDDSSGIVQTPSGRFTLPSMLDRTIRSGTSIATSTASTINPLGIASAIARSNVGAMWTLEDAAKEVLRHAKRPLSIGEMTIMLRAAGVLKGTRSNSEAEVRSQLIQEMLQHGRESTFVRVGNNTYALRYYPAASGSIGDEDEDDAANDITTPDQSDAELAIDLLHEIATNEGIVSETPVLPSTPPIRSGLSRTSNSPLVRSAAENIAPESLLDQDDAAEKALLQRIRKSDDRRFERFMVVFLASVGMTDVVVINRIHPSELDIHATLTVAEVMDVHFWIQAVNWRRDVNDNDIQLLRGKMRIGDHGIMITTSDLQRSAIDEANRQEAIPISSINGTRLAKIARAKGAARVMMG